MSVGKDEKGLCRHGHLMNVWIKILKSVDADPYFFVSLNLLKLIHCS